jgi:two-component system CheB/CheR fusion protein
VQTTDGKWYTLRIQPYRTLDNVIEGAVMSFVEVSEIVAARESLRQANQQLLRLAVVVRDAHDAMTVQDMAGQIQAWNPAAERIYGWSEREALTMNVSQRIPQHLQAQERARLQQLSAGQYLEPYDAQRLTRDGKTLSAWVIATALVNDRGQVYAIATTERICDPPSINLEHKSG